MRRLFAVLSLLLSCSVPLWGQKSVPGAIAEIHGQVVFSSGRAASTGVLITLEGAGSGVFRQAQTDDRGKFEFSGLVPERYTVKARFPGYLDAEENLDLTVGRMGYARLVLKEEPGAAKIPPEGPGAAISSRDANVPEKARKEFAKGEELLSKGEDPGASVGHFEKAIAAYPKYTEAYVELGVAYAAQKKWKEANTALQKAIELNPNKPAAYIALGVTENLQGKHAEAEKPLLKAVELNPESADAHFELARTYWALGRWQDADPHAVKTLQLKPDNAAAHILMGNILLRKRDAPGALKEFKESLRLDPKGPLAEPTKQMIAKIEAALKNAK